MKNPNLTPNAQKYLNLISAQRLALQEEDYGEALEIEEAIERLTDKLTEEDKELIHEVQG